MHSRYDAIVIGGGHNGLVTACYLARAKWKVCVLERRPLVGGACVTEEIFPGFKFSTAAYVNSLFRPEIVRDLNLTAYGYEVIERNPASFTPFLDGRYLMLGRGVAADAREIAKFSTHDSEAYPQYEAMLARVASVIEPTLMQTPPNVLRPKLGDVANGLRLARSMQRLGTAMSEALEILTGAARLILDRWFESEALKGTLATDAIIGAFMAPSMPGTAYVLFHHVMGETNGKKGVWAYMRGGMGGITQALAKAAKGLGAEIYTEAEVAKVIVKDGRATGVTLANGDEISARKIASGVDMRHTFGRFVDPALLPPDFRNAIARISYDSASLKINAALDRLPSFTSLPGHEPGPQHHGTVHLCPDQDFIERAYDDAKYGSPSNEPVVEFQMPSSLDETLAPPGKHVVSMFVQYAPYRLRDGAWTQLLKDEFADRCFAIVERYAPGFTASVIDRQILSPPDLEERFGLTGGNIFQGSMSLDNLFAFRPVPGYAGYQTPIENLYMCGSAAHPGGGVMGAAGRNAAHVMLRS
jgi:phytoene dehydrogenase-like protein